MLVYIKLVLTAIFWGGTFVAGRVLAQEMGPFSAAFLRFLLASIFLCLLVSRHEGRLPLLKRRELLLAVLLGLTGVFSYNALFFSGLKTVTASRASLIIASNPVLIALCSAFFFKEKLYVSTLFGILFCVLGAVVVISRGNPLEIFRGSMGWGEVYIIGCVFSWTAYSLVGKVIMKNLAPMIAVTYSCLIGAVALSYPALLENLSYTVTHCSLQAWMSIFYLGFFGSALGFWWYYEGIQMIGASRAAVFINIVPVSAVLLAWLLLKETIDLSLLLGLVLVSSGLFLTNRKTACSAHHIVE
ncbi:MAG: DMT family transporter [Deltaproteobacteria bacterium]|nr:DMT family transporter [Deltaproteobacteria bacterium]MBW2069822.1 DMT family transporter [Deltaproteobacteria bacterium]